MKVVSINSIGTSGLNTDQTPWELPEAFITSGNNFRVQNGSLLSNGGHSTWISNSAFVNAGFILPLSGQFANVFLIATTHGVYSFDGANFTSILTISPAIYDVRGWSGGMMGGIPVLNHPQIGPYYWIPSTSAPPQMQPLPFSQTQDWNAVDKYGMVLRAHKNFLFMLYMTEMQSGTWIEMPDTYRWSHPADINSIPPTWDETDPNFLAGMAALGDDSGKILDGLSLRDSFVIYSEKAINILEPSGDEFVWTRRQLTTTAGILARDCVVEVNGLHYFLTNGDAYVFDGNKPVSIMQGKVRKHLQSNLSHQHYDSSFVVVNLNYKEIWFCVPVQGSESPNLAYLYNWVDESWAIRDLPDNLTFGAFGQKTGGIISWAVLQAMSPQPTWGTYQPTWGASTSSPFDGTVIVSSETGALLDVDISGSALAGTDASTYPNTQVQRSNYTLDGIIGVTSIDQVYPKIQGSMPVKFTFGSQDYPDSPIRWKPSIVFDPSSQRRINVRTTGALHAWKVESINGGQFALSGMDIVYAPSGVR